MTLKQTICHHVFIFWSVVSLWFTYTIFRVPRVVKIQEISLKCLSVHLRKYFILSRDFVLTLVQKLHGTSSNSKLNSSELFAQFVSNKSVSNSHNKKKFTLSVSFQLPRVAVTVVQQPSYSILGWNDGYYLSMLPPYIVTSDFLWILFLIVNP